jgi:hypothetical protein
MTPPRYAVVRNPLHNGAAARRPRHSPRSSPLQRNELLPCKLLDPTRVCAFATPPRHIGAGGRDDQLALQTAARMARARTGPLGHALAVLSAGAALVGVRAQTNATNAVLNLGATSGFDGCVRGVMRRLSRRCCQRGSARGYPGSVAPWAGQPCLLLPGAARRRLVAPAPPPCPYAERGFLPGWSSAGWGGQGATRCARGLPRCFG